MNFIPKPNGVIKNNDGLWQACPSMKADCGEFDSICLTAFAERAKINFELVKDNADLILKKDISLLNEEYILEVTPKTVTVNASTALGVILALTTLFMSLKENTVPCFSLKDSPKYSYRGLLLDCARHYFSIDEIKKVIEQMALTKLNKLHWHLTDDQGWRIEIKAYPALHEQNQYYTQEEIRNVVSYAKARNIEVIPEIDLPGHNTAAIHIFPWLSCAEKQVSRPTGGGIYKSILCAGKESTYEFVYKVLDEVAELFESPKFHIGGDEAPKMEWMKCPHCKERLTEINKISVNGVGGFEDLQGYFTERIAKYLKAKGKDVICWNETLKAKSLPDNLTIQYWMPGPDDERTAEFFHKGGAMIFSNMFYLYLDYPHAMMPLKGVYEYTPAIQGKSCENEANTLGLEACLWSERVDTPEKLATQLFPRVFALAEAAWSYEKDYKDFEQRLEHQLKMLREFGMTHTQPENFNPSAEEKKIAFNNMFGHLLDPSTITDENRVTLADVYNDEVARDFLNMFGVDYTALG